MRWLLLYPVILLLAGVAGAVEPFTEDGFRRALPGYEFEFPRDHGAHPEFRTEWWYFTGNLETAEGRAFGYQLTVFRTSLDPPGEGIGERSPLAASQLYIGHFAISDIRNERHAAWERAGREGFGQARASSERLDIALGEWTIEMDDSEQIRLRAKEEGAALELALIPEKPLVVHGEDGAHKKGEDPGQASHYLSYTRLRTEGTLRWEGTEHTVTGLSWMDHEFGSAWLGEEETGWDWFALQLDSGEDVMVYRLRRADGSYTQGGSGSVVETDGAQRVLPWDGYTIEVLDTWESPHSGAVYPARWTIEMPGEEVVLEVVPLFADQEMLTERYTGTVYWEGAVRVEGTWRGEPVRGRGYVELVGYAEEFGLL